ncbi:hypothetical protein ACFQQB_46285 [Nonomuraea rubra]|uniref:hypothetical protein n=1 Tax=Nonomuraea rubra TaxID=46180 RepID=UPI00361C7415
MLVAGHRDDLHADPLQDVQQPRPVGSSIAILSPGRAAVWQRSWTASYPPPTASQPSAWNGQSGSTAARSRGVIVARA